MKPVCPRCKMLGWGENDLFCHSCGWKYSMPFQSIQQTFQPEPCEPETKMSISSVGVLSLIFFGGLAILMFAIGASIVGLFLAVLAVLTLCGCIRFEKEPTTPTVQQPQYYPQAQPIQPMTQPRNKYQIICKRCGSPNITVTLNSYQAGMYGRNEARKKSLAKRTKQSLNRSIANVSTLGMWGLFTKKPSKYQENTYTRFNNVTEKIAICQSCGNSWKVR